MGPFFKEIVLETGAEMALIDINDRVQMAVEESGIQNGLLTVSTKHTTSAIVVNEKESSLQEDMLFFLKELIQAGKEFLHDKNAVDGRRNAHSHLMSLLLPTSQSLPVREGKLSLGPWQNFFFIELDGPRRERYFTVQILGE